MATNYERFGLTPDCNLRQLKHAYRKLRRELPPGDKAAVVSLRKAYDDLRSDLRLRRKDVPAIVSFFSRFGFLTFGIAVGIVVAACLVHYFLSLITPNFFPNSAYPDLALRFSKALAGYIGHLVFYICFVLIYIFSSLRRRKATGMRHLCAGFVFGCIVLGLGLLLPTNLFSNTGAMLMDLPNLQSGELAVAEHVQISPAVSRITIPFGESLHAGAKHTIYFPKDTYTGDGDIATVYYLPHTRAAGKIELEAKKADLLSFSNGTTKTVDAAGQTLSIERDTGIFQMQRQDGTLVQAALPRMSDDFLSRQVGIGTLPSGDGFACYATGQQAMLAVLDPQTGEYKGNWNLGSGTLCALYQNNNLLLILTRQAEGSSSLLSQYDYSLALYDAQTNTLLYQSKKPVVSRAELDVGGFTANSVWLTKSSTFENQTQFRFVLPADCMQQLKKPMATYY